MTDLFEPIDVWVLFKKAKIEPYIFFWHGRRIQIEEINMVHTSKQEGLLVYHFSVSSMGNFYRLQLNPQHMKWFIENLEEDS